MTPTNLALVTYLARDYDEAIDWFRKALGFHLLEDTDQGGGKRWIRMAAGPKAATALMIAKAVDAQTEQIGKAAAGPFAFVLTTDDFNAMHDHMLDNGIHFEEAPRHEPYGTVAVFRDLYGNRWDLLQPT